MRTNESVSASLNNIAQTYEQIKLALDYKLTPQGYVILEEEFHPQAFGSRLVIWSNNKDSKRLLWDGKDGWFYLQSLNTLPVDWRDDWTDLIYIPFDSENHDLQYKWEITAKSYEVSYSSSLLTKK